MGNLMIPFQKRGMSWVPFPVYSVLFSWFYQHSFRRPFWSAWNPTKMTIAFAPFFFVTCFVTPGSGPVRKYQERQKLLLMAEIPHHLKCKKTCKYWEKLHINWCRISAINSITRKHASSAWKWKRSVRSSLFSLAWPEKNKNCRALSKCLTSPSMKMCNIAILESCL